MDNFGSRLREERERLGLSQAELGEIGGVKKLAQFNYEKGERQPGASYLSAIGTAGIDVMYILTGSRASPVPEPLSQRERHLLANYRGSSEEGRRAVESTASALAHKDGAKQTGRGK
ncbi:helix-turn-helix domain-containing protein [Gilvimarinus agarilyticus]|uniref:helix-turn-helix domain-containing protein n=1 Tax=Gilvimarinus agarilyticus TaxID=679259 RepID=UPI0005A18BAF|nr:helix-turn-helix transcriptional regulator [Gilvimarinus agarilyticus]